MEKVLVIDDEIKVLKVINEFLKIKGYQVILAESGMEGLKIFKQENPSLVIVDIIMPGIDGIEVLNEIKKYSPNAEVIMLTAYEDSDLAIKSFHFEAFDFITKPIDPDELYLSLKRASEKLLMKKQLQDHTKDLEQLVETFTKSLLKLESKAVIGYLTQGLLHSFIDPLSVITTRAEFLFFKLKEMKDKIIFFHDYPKTDSDQLQLKMEKNIQDIEIILQKSRFITKVSEKVLQRALEEENKEEEPIEVNQIIEDEMKIFNTHLFFKHRIEKKFNKGQGLGKVRMVQRDFRQIIDNLMVNAIENLKDAPEKKLTITTWQDKRNIYIDFTDTRSNDFVNEDMPVHEADEFQKVNSKLYSSRYLIKKYGGIIEEAPVNMNEQMNFRITIPGSKVIN